MQVNDFKDNKVLTHAELKNQLREQLNRKKDNRRSNITRRLRQETTPLSKMHENQNLLAQAELMLADMELPSIKKLGDQVKKAMVLKEKYSFLNKNYPHIFMAIIRGEMNLEIFKMMLSARNLIKDGKITQHSADEKMGQFLYNKYTSKK